VVARVLHQVLAVLEAPVAQGDLSGPVLQAALGRRSAHYRLAVQGAPTDLKAPDALDLLARLCHPVVPGAREALGVQGDHFLLGDP
jgi:hypothetical protein